MSKVVAWVGGITLLLVVGVWALPGPEPPSGITGPWTAQVGLETGGGSAEFLLRQDDETLTGTYDGAYGTVPLAGTVTGNDVEFSFAPEGGTVVFTSTINGATISGTCDYGDIAGRGWWTATRSGSAPFSFLQ